MTKQDQIIAKQLAEKLRESATGSVQRIILYGSRARGTATSESDYDMLVIEKDSIVKREEMQHLRSALHDSDVPVDVSVMGEEEFEETKGVIGGLAYPKNKYGIVVYENAWSNPVKD